jgi:minor histocompatibility antigen H13
MRPSRSSGRETTSKHDEPLPCWVWVCLSTPGDARLIVREGDIVLPGVFIALARRFDYHLALKRSGKPLLPSDGYATPYYRWQIASYLLALATTMVAMHWSNHPQPALLYIAPACLAGVALCAAWRGEWQEMCSWTEQDEDTAKDGKQAKVDDKDA